MNGFVIYAFTITGLYIIYMSVVFILDLFRKTGRKEEVAEEIISSDLAGDEEDDSAVVDESPDGYSVRQGGDSVAAVPEEEPAAPVAGDDEEVPEERYEEEQPVADDPDDEELLEQESLDSRAAYDSLKAVQARMDGIRPSYQEELRSDEFAVMMAQPMTHKSRMLRHFVDKL